MIFFTATATNQSRVNISPREIGALRLLDDTTAISLDRTGSGNETAAHLKADGRMTIMMCALSGPPQILRLYGRGQSIFWDSPTFTNLIDTHYAGDTPLGTRQIVRLEIDLVKTSCGFGVPLFDHQGPRQSMENGHTNKRPERHRQLLA